MTVIFHFPSRSLFPGGWLGSLTSCPTPIWRGFQVDAGGVSLSRRPVARQTSPGGALQEALCNPLLPPRLWSLSLAWQQPFEMILGSGSCPHFSFRVCVMGGTTGEKNPGLRFPCSYSSQQQSFLRADQRPEMNSANITAQGAFLFPQLPPWPGHPSTLRKSSLHFETVSLTGPELTK